MPPPRAATNDRTRVQPVGYSRYDQERFNKDQTAGFKIETGLTFQGMYCGVIYHKTSGQS